MIIDLSNDFHNTTIRVRVPKMPYTLSIDQTKRVFRTLCGMEDCSCGSIRGPQTAFLHDNVTIILLTELMIRVEDLQDQDGNSRLQLHWRK